jgi:tetratricopeptide (TPR) repeat protein
MNKKEPSLSLERLASIATSQALEGNWELASRINKEVLKIDPDNIDALNRLGFALAEIGRIPQAAKSYRKVLKIDPYNTIASKNLKRLKVVKGKSKKIIMNHKSNSICHPEKLFLEEPGKTATIPLVCLTEPQVLLYLNCADKVNLLPKSHQISICDQSGKYIGKLPDNVAARLLRLIQGGNRYEAYVKSTRDNHVQIFVREIKRSKRFEAVHSFPIEDKYSYVSFTPPDLVHNDQPETAALEEQDSTEPANEGADED